jgi:hypothetical protein
MAQDDDVIETNALETSMETAMQELRLVAEEILDTFVR